MIQVNRGSKVENADGTFTNRGSIFVTKNKTAPPYKRGEYDMEHGSGISISQEVLDYGVPTRVIYKAGNTFFYDESFENNPDNKDSHIKLGGSKAAAKTFLNDNLELRAILADFIVETINRDFHEDELNLEEQRD